MRLAILNPGAAFQRRAIVQNENDCIITPDNVPTFKNPPRPQLLPAWGEVPKGRRRGSD